MKLRLLSEDFNKQPKNIQEALLVEMLHGQFIGKTGNKELDELLFLGTWLDLGWEDLAKAHGVDYLAFARQLIETGYRIPGAACCMHSGRHYGVFDIGPSEGTEPELPNDWLEFIQVIDTRRPQNHVIWYGKQVRPERQASDLENFEAVDHGFRRVRG